MMETTGWTVPGSLEEWDGMCEIALSKLPCGISAATKTCKGYKLEFLAWGETVSRLSLP